MGGVQIGLLFRLRGVRWCNAEGVQGRHGFCARVSERRGLLRREVPSNATPLGYVRVCVCVGVWLCFTSPRAQNSPKAFYSMAFRPFKALKI